jgi:Flp pilus assembly protein TadG
MRAFFANKSGAAAVEFAICAPLLISLTLGVTEFGRALWCHHMLVKMGRDATRYLSRVPDPTNATYQNAATNLALSGSLAAATPALMPASYGTAPASCANAQSSGVVCISFPAPVTVAAPTIGGVTGWSTTQPATAKYVTTNVSFTFTSTLISWLGLGVNIPMNVSHSERLQTD